MIPLMVFTYLKIQSDESWPLSIGLTAAAWFSFWGLFVKVLNLPFPDGTGLYLARLDLILYTRIVFRRLPRTSIRCAVWISYVRASGVRKFFNPGSSG